MDMSADVPSKEALDQAGVLAGWLRENDHGSHTVAVLKSHYAATRTERSESNL